MDETPATETASERRAITDRRGRPIRDLRVSVTDRCNFRCRYCLPRETVAAQQFLPRSALLRFEDVARLCGIFVGLGVDKIRLTGGEPLLRKELPRLVEMLAGLNVDLALTTNGVLLPTHARALAAAGLSRVTVSLDALDEHIFQAMSDAPAFSVRDVLNGIDAAAEAGLGPIKINMVVRRGVNEQQVLPMARHFRAAGHTLRFIEYMDVGTLNGWSPADVVSRAEIIELLEPLGEVRSLPRVRSSDVAEPAGLASGGAPWGVIASVSEPFCSQCTRARLSAEGSLVPCLFARSGLDLREPLRRGCSDAEFAEMIAAFWSRRDDHYSELRAAQDHAGAHRRLPLAGDRVEMAYIGG